MVSWDVVSPRIRAAAALLPMILLPALAAGCAARTKGAPEGWPAQTDWIVDGRTGAPATFAEMMADLQGADVVFIGEDHSNPHHHEAQRRIAEVLVATHRDLAFGFEMLQTVAQPAADRWVAGTIDVDGFVQETDWRRTWGFPIELYLPLFELAKKHGRPVLALNTPEELVKRVREVGVEGLSPEEKKALPELDLDDAAHQEWVRAAFAAHHSLPEDRFRRFYAIQVLWDETMAEEIARAIRPKQEPGGAPRHVVVFAGTGHLIRRLGIPSRLERRVPGAKTRVVLALPALENTPREIRRSVETKDADWMWITPDVEDASF